MGEEHNFDPPKTPGQRLHEALYSEADSMMPPWCMITAANQSWYEAAATEFLAGEPKAESVAEAVLREREACAKITAETPVKTMTIKTANANLTVSDGGATKTAIADAIRARGETWQEYLKQAVDRRQQGLR